MGFFARPAAIESYQRMRDWTEFRLPYDGSVSSISRVRMPNLMTLYLSENPVTTLPWTNFPALTALYAEYSGLESADLYLVPNLTFVGFQSCYALDYINAAGMTFLYSIDANYCESLTDVNLLVGHDWRPM